MAETAEVVDTTATTAETTVDTAWQQAIPADYAKDKVWEPYKSKGLPDVLKTYADQAKLLGRSVQLPQKDATGKIVNLDEWRKTNLPKFQELGIVPSVPAAPTDYKFERPAAAEQLGWDTDAETHMRGVWHKANMSNDQVNAVVAGYAEWQERRLGMAEGFVKKTEDELKAEWGAEYDARLGASVRFVKTTGEKYGIPGLLATTGLGSHANVIRWVADLAKGSGEHTAMDSSTSTTGTTGDFERRHQEILVEMSKANPGSPRAAELQANLETLLKQRYPG